MQQSSYHGSYRGKVQGAGRGGGHLEPGRPLWGRVTKPKPLDSGGHELYTGSPGGLIPVFTLLTYCSSFFRNLLYLDCWTPESPDFHWPLLLSLLFLTMTFWSPDLDPWTTCLSTQAYFWIPVPCVKVAYEVPCDVPIASQTQNFMPEPQPASSLVVPVSGHGASFSMVLRPKSLFLFCSDSSPDPSSKSCYPYIIFHGSTPFSPRPPFSLLAGIAGALQHMPRPQTCCTAHTTRVAL